MRTPLKLLMVMNKQTVQQYIRNIIVPTWWLEHREITGSTAFDSSGNNLDGTITSATVGQTGRLGPDQAIDFDGVNDLITVSIDALISATTEMTYAFLFKADNDGEDNQGKFFRFGDGVTVFGYAGSNNLLGRVDYDTTDATTTVTEDYAADVWQWAFMTFSETGDRTVHIYRGINGAVAELVSGLSATASVGSRVTETADLIIGNQAAATATFDGLIDEAFNVNRALTTADMQALVNLTGV